MHMVSVVSDLPVVVVAYWRYGATVLAMFVSPFVGAALSLCLPLSPPSEPYGNPSESLEAPSFSPIPLLFSTAIESLPALLCGRRDQT